MSYPVIASTARLAAFVAVLAPDRALALASCLAPALGGASEEMARLAVAPRSERLRAFAAALATGRGDPAVAASHPLLARLVREIAASHPASPEPAAPRTVVRPADHVARTRPSPAADAPRRGGWHAVWNWRRA